MELLYKCQVHSKQMFRVTTAAEAGNFKGAS